MRWKSIHIKYDTYFSIEFGKKVLYWNFNLKSWFASFFYLWKRPQINFSSQYFSVENRYCAKKYIHHEKPVKNILKFFAFSPNRSKSGFKIEGSKTVRLNATIEKLIRNLSLFENSKCDEVQNIQIKFVKKFHWNFFFLYEIYYYFSINLIIHIVIKIIFFGSSCRCFINTRKRSANPFSTWTNTEKKNK